jgi:hypothetical protein
MYEIVEDRERGLLLITLSGFWDEDEFDRYAADLTEASRRMGRLLRGRLLDCRSLSVQAPAVAQRFQSAVAVLDAAFTPFTALILTASLARLQGQRVFPGTERMRWFLDEAEALDWLITAHDR